MTLERIGIALAAYNPNIDYFEAQLASIASQDHTSWRCFICFDSDMKSIIDHPQISRFRFDSRFDWCQNEERLGHTKNFESAIRRCLDSSVTYVCCSDQDDIWLPTKLSRCEAALKQAPPLSLVHCDMFILKENDRGQFTRTTRTAWKVERRGVDHVSVSDLLIRSVVAGAAMMMDAKLASIFLTVPYPAYEHDHWYSLAAASNGGVYPIHEPLYDYRIHKTNVSGLSEYQGFFTKTTRLGEVSLIEKCMIAFNGTALRATTGAASGIKIPIATLIMTRSFSDFGSLYVLKALRVLSADRALARACISRAIGKFARFFRPGFKEARYR